ncbi:MAG: hypothetical protein KKF62_08440, partial [Bacteroidetes bacterium]|nr:hypothetical protein [Bacteroidota bacterium]MBU1117095.1 hypothetical protein [Bacteroidota bacterium]MBU1799773.1 hypothetical protein [Bacteroidota bacterium]
MKILFFLFLISSITTYSQIQNSGFESGTEHWTGDNYLFISPSDTYVHTGTKSLYCVIQNHTTADNDLRSEMITGISPSTLYTLSAWFYHENSGSYAWLAVEWYDASEHIISENISNNSTSTASHFIWYKLTSDFTSPANAVACKVGARFQWGADGYPAGVITVDDFEGIPAPLPVELNVFTAKASGSSVTLKWQTATEVNNYGFEVERKKVKGESEWETIGFLEGHGNSNSPKDYSFTDTQTSEVFKNLGGLDGELQYRLKQMDFDGNYEYSDVVEVKFAEDVKEYK